MIADVESSLQATVSTIQKFQFLCSGQIVELAKLMIDVLLKGHKILICGNGGSAADAQHFAGELIASFELGLERKSLPVLALSTNTSVLTAIANDFSYEKVFSRQVEGLGQKGDLLIAISTSGNSANCLSAVQTARHRGMLTSALTRSSSKLFDYVDVAIGVPSLSTAHIQACHVIAFHIISEEIDRAFAEGNS